MILVDASAIVAILGDERDGAALLALVAAAEADLALAAFARCGKGQGHPAQLNLGGCFAHAAARHHGAALLCKGGDFPHTDAGLAGR